MLAASGILSLALVLATMELVCVLVNRIFGLPRDSGYRVIWIAK